MHQLVIVIVIFNTKRVFSAEVRCYSCKVDFSFLMVCLSATVKVKIKSFEESFLSSSPFHSCWSKFFLVRVNFFLLNDQIVCLTC